MTTSLVNILLAFLEGLALILSPCIIPILPIVLSASVTGSKRRPYGVIVGFVVSFALFTFFSRQLVLWFGVNLNIIRDISFGLLFLLGVIMLSTRLTEKFTYITEGFANFGMRITKDSSGEGFGSGLFFGVLIGLIWTPCAGPILAAVIVESVLQQTNFFSFLTILAFAIGAAVPMLVIVLFGRVLVNKTKFLQQHAVLIRKILGLVIILAVLLMIYGSNWYAPMPKQTAAKTSDSMKLQDGITPIVAPDFKNITAWINSPPLHIKDLHGKVVLIDFWAYSCINCIRTLPYLNDWYKKYQDHGLVIVGVHSPEFDFERDLQNVQKAVQGDGIKYPVALDNDFATWNAYQNEFWPAHYLIDKNGNIVYVHFGEGDYDITEDNIRFLLGIKTPSTASSASQPFEIINPETYLGYERGVGYMSREEQQRDQAATYSYPTEIASMAWALQGGWKITAEKIISTSNNAAIELSYRAKNVFAVMGASQPTKVTVKNNGAMVTTLEVSGHNLYTLLQLSQLSSGVVELIVSDPGLELYTFTFGG